jgi:ubiquinone/menaquinone biosynthesis C-methylase UbiE
MAVHMDHHDWHSEAYARGWKERVAKRPSREEYFMAAVRILPFELHDEFTLVDVGAGYGAFAEFLLAHFPNSKAIVSDYAEPMLDMAGEQLAGYGDRVSFFQADLTVPGCLAPLKGAGISLAVSSIAIHNLRQPELIRGAYAEVCSVLQTPGYFINEDYVLADSEAADWYYRKLEVRREPTKADRAGRLPNFPGRASDQLRWLREAGFDWADVPWRQGALTLLFGVKTGS